MAAACRGSGTTDFCPDGAGSAACVEKTQAESANTMPAQTPAHLETGRKRAMARMRRLRLLPEKLAVSGAGAGLRAAMDKSVRA